MAVGTYSGSGVSLSTLLSSGTVLGQGNCSYRWRSYSVEKKKPAKYYLIYITYIQYSYVWTIYIRLFFDIKDKKVHRQIRETLNLKEQETIPRSSRIYRFKFLSKHLFGSIYCFLFSFHIRGNDIQNTGCFWLYVWENTRSHKHMIHLERHRKNIMIKWYLRELFSFCRFKDSSPIVSKIFEIFCALFFFRIFKEISFLGD